MPAPRSFLVHRSLGVVGSVGGLPSQFPPVSCIWYTLPRLECSAPTRKTICCGYTLLELLVVLSILAGVLSLSIPALTPKPSGELAIFQLYEDLQLARWTAINHQKVVKVCPIDESYQCVSIWQKDYKLFIDDNGHEHVIKYTHLTSPVSKLQASFNHTHLSFTPTGLCHQQGTFIVHSDQKDYRLVFLRSARMRIEVT